jgi:DNA polymerase-4
MPADRSILHLDLDTFFVSVERLMDSRLEGMPILVGGTSDRGVVAACSYEARRFGVHSGMPMQLARRLCPEATLIRGNTSNYTKYSKAVTDIVRESVPVCEKSSIDEFYADLTGMDRFYGCLAVSGELRDRIVRETGLPISFGLSNNKTVSKVATGEGKPLGATHVGQGGERSFLAPLSIRKIPMVGDRTYQTLRGLGIRQIATLQEVPVEMMERVLGKSGRMIWRKAHGHDPSPVVATTERKSISSERTFASDTTDLEKMRTILLAMAENLAFQLRRGGKLTGCITVKVRYADFDTRTLQARIPSTAADHLLIPQVLEMFGKLYNRRVRVRLIGVRYSQLVDGGMQLDLFHADQERNQLYLAVDKLRAQFGARSVVSAAGLTARSIGGFNPFSGEPPIPLANRRQ